MKRSTGRILTTHVGSLPRPQDLAGMIMGGAQAGTPEQRAAFDARVISAVNEAVEKQIAAGIDIVSDGEQAKIGFVNYVKDRLDGFNGKATPFMAADLMEFQGLGAGGAAAAAAQQQARARESGEAPPPPPNWTPACDGPIAIASTMLTLRTSQTSSPPSPVSSTKKPSSAQSRRETSPRCLRTSTTRRERST